MRQGRGTFKGNKTVVNERSNGGVLMNESRKARRKKTDKKAERERSMWHKVTNSISKQ